MHRRTDTPPAAAAPTPAPPSPPSSPSPPRRAAARARARRSVRARFDSLFRNVPTGVYRTTPGGKILLANPALLRMLGFDSFEELARHDLEQDGMHASYPRAAFRARLEAEGEILGLECTWRRRDGSLIYVRENATAVRAGRAQGGRVLYYEGTVEDISEYRRAAEALRESEATLRGFYDSVAMLMGIVELTDPARGGGEDIVFVSQNAAAAALMNTTQDAMRGRRASELGIPAPAVAFWRAHYLEAARTGRPVRFECGLSRRAPERRFEVTVQQVRGRRFCYIAEDVTESRRLQRRVEGSLESLIVALEAKDPRTRDHSARVARLAAQIAGHLRPDDEAFAARVRVAALFHDIGKIGVSEAVLNKTGRLTPDEVAEVRRHPEIGETILRPLLEPEVVAMVRGHHERVGGGGYPDGLAGDAVPLGARIIAVADAYDAMISPRPYSPVRPPGDVLAALREGAGAQWDAGAVAALLHLAAQGLLPPPASGAAASPAAAATALLSPA